MIDIVTWHTLGRGKFFYVVEVFGEKRKNEKSEITYIDNKNTKKNTDLRT